MAIDKRHNSRVMHNLYCRYINDCFYDKNFADNVPG